MVPVARSPENLDGQGDDDRRETGEHKNQSTFHNDVHFVSLLARGCHAGCAGLETRPAPNRFVAGVSFSGRPPTGRRADAALLYATGRRPATEIRTGGGNGLKRFSGRRGAGL
jgi:hypothetical protein